MSVTFVLDADSTGKKIDLMMKLKLSKIDFNMAMVMIIDAALCILSLYAAYLFRFDFNIPDQWLKPFFAVVPVALAAKIASFYFCDLYRGMWRYTSIADLTNIIKAASLGSLLLICYVLFRYRFIGFQGSGRKSC